MKGDFSRIRFNPQKQYTAVLQQQGRVSLDADANEQCFIDGYLQSRETIDAVGEYGAPVNDAGFAITVSGTELVIGSGRYYVEGLMCENPTSNLAYNQQPYYVNPSPLDSALLSQLSSQSGSAIQVYLQVWQRLVTALDDGCLREPALGQADTTTRLQTVWRVIAEFVPPPTTAPTPAPTPAPAPPTGLTINPVLVNQAATKVTLAATDIAAQKITATAAEQNLALSQAGLTAAATKAASAATATGLATNAAATPAPATPDCCAQMYQQLRLLSTATMSAMTSGGGSDCSCQPIPAAGYQGLENQLYRIEIHQGGPASSATYKWSRENASVVAAIQKVSGPTLYVNSTGPDANLGFQNGNWVEIYDDTNLFGQTPNQPGTLCQILTVDPTGPSITLTATAPSVDPTKNARVRRWDQSTGGAAGIPISAGTWQTLENGIQVQFGSGFYLQGDYWLVVARTASGQIDWPPCGSDGNLFQPAKNVPVYNAPLACIHWNATNNQAVPEDCRRFFSPLTSLTPGTPPSALHITNYSWRNDDLTTFDALLSSGLTVTLDGAPTSPVTGANFIVTIETVNTAIITDFSQAAATTNAIPAAAPAPAAAAPVAATPAATAPVAATVSAAAPPVAATTVAATTLLKSPILTSVPILFSNFSFTDYTPVFQVLPLFNSILDWQITVNASSNQIVWTLPSTDLTGLQSRYLLFINEMLGLLVQYGIIPRLRIRLLGSTIFAQSGATQTYLDGHAFAYGSTRQNSSTPCLALTMPSGSGVKGSDFEGWLYLAPFNGVIAISMNYTALTVTANTSGVVTGAQAGSPPAPVTAIVTVTLAYVAVLPAGVTVNLSLSGVTLAAGTSASSFVGLAATTLVIPQGSTTGTVNVNVFGNPGAGVTDTFQVGAAVQLATGAGESQTVTFTLAGVATNIIFKAPGLPGINLTST
jgi:hypothetical protein